MWQLLKSPGLRCLAGGLYVTTALKQARALFPADVTLIRGEGEAAVAALLDKQPLPEKPLPPDGWAEPSRDELAHYLRYGGVISLRTAAGAPDSAPSARRRACPRLDSRPVHPLGRGGDEDAGGPLRRGIQFRGR